MILMLSLMVLLFVSTNQAEDILEPCVSSIVSELRKIKTLEADIQELKAQITGNFSVSDMICSCTFYCA